LMYEIWGTCDGGWHSNVYVVSSTKTTLDDTPPILTRLSTIPSNNEYLVQMALNITDDASFFSGYGFLLVLNLTYIGKLVFRIQKVKCQIFLLNKLVFTLEISKMACML
jgi:hypothetical protein